MALNETLIAMQRQIARLQAEIGRLMVQESGGANAATAAANTLFAGPASGSAAAPTFRALTAADLPQAPGFSVHKNGTAQAITANTQTKITWSTETYDSGNQFASSRFTVAVAGGYLQTINITWSDNAIALGTMLLTIVYKNGVVFRAARLYPTLAPAVGVFWDVPITFLDRAAVGDYYEIYVYQGDTGSRNVYGGAANTYWTAQWLGN
jgi:hypothetical protein